MIRPWMYKKFWIQRPEESDEDYPVRKKEQMNDYLAVIRNRGLPIVLKKDSGLKIVYSKDFQFEENTKCEICKFTIDPAEKRIHMIRIIDPDYPEGLISDTTSGVLCKCKCKDILYPHKKKNRTRRPSSRKEDRPEDTFLPYKEQEEFPF